MLRLSSRRKWKKLFWSSCEKNNLQVARELPAKFLFMEQLKLDNQLCFPFYSISRLIIRRYQPFLDQLGITYPQYLVLLVLWENDNQPVNDIAKRLFLQTNTVTPLLKRMESQGIITREKATDDERKVIISLTDNGKEMELLAAEIPDKLTEEMNNFSKDELKALHSTLYRMIDQLK